MDVTSGCSYLTGTATGDLARTGVEELVSSVPVIVVVGPKLMATAVARWKTALVALTPQMVLALATEIWVRVPSFNAQADCPGSH